MTGPGRRGFFELLEPASRDALRAVATVRQWHPGATLARAGDAPARVLVVRSGRVKIVVSSVDGAEVVLAIRGPGDIVGEVAAVDGLPHSATAIAMEEVSCYAVTSDRFSRFLAEHPSGGVAVAAILAARLREADGRRAEFGALDTVERVVRRLSELASSERAEAGDGGLTVRITQDELAGLTGASREAVSRALRLLRSEGLVTTRRRGITVLDLEALGRRG